MVFLIVLNNEEFKLENVLIIFCGIFCIYLINYLNYFFVLFVVLEKNLVIVLGKLLNIW